MTLRRRHLVGGLVSAGLSGPLLMGCRPADTDRTPLSGGWAEDPLAAGHAWRDHPQTAPAGSPLAGRMDVAIVGGGVAGLAAARALMRAGVDDVRLFEMDTAPGGNSRGHRVLGLPCPSGAHYLPQPGPRAHEVRELLFDLGLLRLEAGRAVADERHLCHSPQERVFANGRWQAGLLPREGATPRTLEQSRRFARLVREATPLGFAIPTHRAAWRPALAALDAQPFAQWLQAQGLDDPWLIAVLDYACRDDYGAGVAAVSAWAGLHYFASRHGFPAPGEAEDDAEPVFTWPEGNAWLTERLARPLGDRILSGEAVTRLEPGLHAVRIHAAPGAGGAARVWEARQAIVCTPVFIAQRLLAGASDAAAPLAAAARHLRHAPWLVSQLHLREPLLERVDTALAWDNVPLAPGATAESAAGTLAQGLRLPPGLGWVNAAHQSLQPVAQGPMVLTHYWALGSADPAVTAARRAALRDAPWTDWAHAVLAELHAAHPDVNRQVDRIELHRRGHAMATPTPGTRSHPALAALARPAFGRLHFAHADLSGYSVFEEAYTHGLRAGQAAARALR